MSAPHKTKGTCRKEASPRGMRRSLAGRILKKVRGEIVRSAGFLFLYEVDFLIVELGVDDFMESG